MSPECKHIKLEIYVPLDLTTIIYHGGQVYTSPNLQTQKELSVIHDTLCECAVKEAEIVARESANAISKE